ncbi:MAG TPA: hypothetical protein VGH38_23975 [Bryobacteraceae bacterium]
MAGTVWCGIGLIALVALYLRFFQGKGKTDIDRRARIGVLLLGVTGLDIVPILLHERFTHLIQPTIEWWNDQVAAWVTAMLWVPHHVAGLVACLTGFLLLWDVTRFPDRRGRLAVAATAGVMFASALGLTIYVTLVFAIFLGIWVPIAFFRNNRAHARLICLSGLTAFLLALPYLIELFAGDSGPTGAGPLLRFAVKPFTFVDWLFKLDGGWRMAVTNLMLLPLNYSLELGFFLIAGVLQGAVLWRQRHSLTDERVCSFVMAAVSFVVCTFVQSGVIGNNDFGWRGMMIAQFVLLMCGAELLTEGLLSSNARRGRSHVRARHWRGLIVATLVLGTAGSAYEVVKIRFFPLASDRALTGKMRWLAPDGRLGARTHALRQLYETLKQRTPIDAVFQHNPDTDPQDSFHGMYADRQLAAETLTCGVIFGGDAGRCRNRIGDIAAMFDRSKLFDPTRIEESCGRLSIDVLVVKDTDSVWRDPESWVWKRQPFAANPYGRAFYCGSVTSSQTGTP